MAKKDSISSTLCPEAEKFLDDLTTLLKDQSILTSLDEATLQLIGRSYHNYCMATRQLDKDGMTMMSQRGELKAHPCIKIQLDSQIQLNKMMDSFGLSPKSRKEISRPKETKAKQSPIDKFFETSHKNGQVRDKVKN